MPVELEAVGSGSKALVAAAANKGDEWNNSLMEQIARVRKNMRHIERADLCKIKWQNAATTAMVTSLAGRIKRAAAGNYDHRGSVVNPLYNGSVRAKHTKSSRVSHGKTAKIRWSQKWNGSAMSQRIAAHGAKDSMRKK